MAHGALRAARACSSAAGLGPPWEEARGNFCMSSVEMGELALFLLYWVGDGKLQRKQAIVGRIEETQRKNITLKVIYCEICKNRMYEYVTSLSPLGRCNKRP